MRTRFPPRRVLAGVDASDASMSALAAARALSERFGARLSIELVQPPPMAQVPDGMAPIVALGAYEQERSRAREEWTTAVKTATAGMALEPRLAVADGIPEAVLARRATSRSADLVVLGTRGLQGSERLFLGSVAEAVVHRARVPVLTVRAGKALDCRKILAPCHMHRYADEALFYALKLAEAFGGSVTVLYVPPEGNWEVDAELQVRMHLEETFGTHAAKALEVVVRRGDARTEILAEAATGKYGLVALSAHRRGTLSDLALGTTAERLVRRCQTPVLAVPAPRT